MTESTCLNQDSKESNEATKTTLWQILTNSVELIILLK